MIPDEKWTYIVENMPIPSIDMVVYDPDEDKFLLGRRTSEVANGYWFVIGGRIKKHESYREACYRIADEEAGLDIEIAEKLGAYEHFYPEADCDAETGKHYTPTAFVVHADSSQELVTDDQHADLQWFSSPPKLTHKYPLEFLSDAGLR